MFSRRAHWSAPLNRLSLAREALRSSGAELLDLTESNPTQAGIDYPLEELAEALGSAARAAYDPAPLGIRSAREALGAHLGCHPDDLVLTASSSEAYSYLFKLLTDPGDSVLTAIPSYPLLEHLAALELVELRPFTLEFHRRWEIDRVRVAATMDDRSRAIIVVSPNNPTGSYIQAEEQEALASLGLPVIADEVFHVYPLDGQPSPIFATRDDVLSFSLGGLSKSAGLPHLKLGWIRVGGPPAARREAVAALELIADNFLSVSTPVQEALPPLLGIGARIREAIAARTRINLDLARRVVAEAPSLAVLPVEGGWSAVLRVPRLESDEELALGMLSNQGVVVHPGYFFDFPTDGYLVVSLLTPPPILKEGMRRIVEQTSR
jgi:alanine-synthesizing transaminase